jgi:hypothetical protein
LLCVDVLAPEIEIGSFGRNSRSMSFRSAMAEATSPALATLALVIELMVSGLVPNVQAALLGCPLMGLLAASI